MTLLSILQQNATTTKKHGLLLFKDYPLDDVAEAVDKLAGENGLTVHTVKMSTLVGKYIGETEKNLQQLMQKTNSAGAILFFKEGEALFAKRTGVNDSHDRYANRKIASLLHLLEEYDGLVVIATNQKKPIRKPLFGHR